MAQTAAPSGRLNVSDDRAGRRLTILASAMATLPRISAIGGDSRSAKCNFAFDYLRDIAGAYLVRHAARFTPFDHARDRHDGPNPEVAAPPLFINSSAGTSRLVKWGNVWT